MTSPLGILVRARRLELKLTQRKLAQLCDCAVSTISAIECGQSPTTRPHMTLALAKHLGITVEHILRASTVASPA